MKLIKSKFIILPAFGLPPTTQWSVAHRLLTYAVEESPRSCEIIVAYDFFTVKKKYNRHERTAIREDCFKSVARTRRNDQILI